MKLRYVGRRAIPKGCLVIVIDTATGKGTPFVVKTLDETESFTSAQFDWGYTGRNPERLAKALLLHHTNDAAQANRYHMMFKNEFVDSWGDNWEIDSDTIAGWLRTKQAQAETRRTTYSHVPVFPKDFETKTL